MKCIFKNCSNERAGDEYSCPVHGLDHDLRCNSCRRGRVTCCDRHAHSERLRYCRDCDAIFWVNVTRSRLVRCRRCRDKRAATRPRPNPVRKRFTLAEHRYQLETQADPHAATRRILLWNDLLYRVGQAIFCPRCEASLDAKRAVAIDFSEGGGVVRCADCWDKHADKYKQNGLLKGYTDGREIGDSATRAAAGLLGR